MHGCPVCAAGTVRSMVAIARVTLSHPGLRSFRLSKMDSGALTHAIDSGHCVSLAAFPGLRGQLRPDHDIALRSPDSPDIR